jgi:hypothetical protein
MARIHNILVIIIIGIIIMTYFGPSCVEAFGSGISEFGPFGVTNLGYSGFVAGATELGRPNEFESLTGVPMISLHTDDANVVGTIPTNIKRILVHQAGTTSK